PRVNCTTRGSTPDRRTDGPPRRSGPTPPTRFGSGRMSFRVRRLDLCPRRRRRGGARGRRVVRPGAASPAWTGRADPGPDRGEGADRRRGGVPGGFRGTDARTPGTPGGASRTPARAAGPVAVVARARPAGRAVPRPA